MPTNCVSGATAAVLEKETMNAEIVPEMRVIYLNLSDLDELIREYEIQYRASTLEMLSNPEVRQRIPEDDLLELEAYVAQRSSLREHYDCMHREYLQKGRTHRAPKKNAEDDPTAYAA